MVSGQYAVPHPEPYQDSHGTIRLNGVFCSISFTGITPPGIDHDGLWLQIGGTVIPQPEISARRNVGSIEISFPTEVDVPYQIEYATTLLSPDWISLGASIIGDGLSRTYSDNVVEGTARFYRVRLLVCQ